MTYVIGNLHGNYDKYLTMLDKIKFSENDVLYLTGNILDKGEKSAELLMDVFSRENVFPLMGAHEMMAIECLEVILQEVISVNVIDLDFRNILLIQNWISNGGDTTIESFKQLEKKERKYLLEKLKALPLYVDINVGKNRFIIVHAGLGNFAEDKPLNQYTKEELLCQRNDYKRCFADENTYVISAYTPVNSYCEPKIMFKNNHFAIDCGNHPGESLACLELETFEKYYINESDIF